MAIDNTTKSHFKECKAAIKDLVATIPGAGKTWERMRYADNLNEWTELAAVVINDKNTLRVALIYLSDFRSVRDTNRRVKVTAIFAIEVIQQFIEGTDEDNSTQDFEDSLGDIFDLFLPEEALGLVDIDGQNIENSSLTGETGDGGGRPQYVDGILAHRKILNLEVTFRICK